MALGRFGAAARKLGKSARTRARLMDATAIVLARDGIEAASINEIANTAELANGTFYNHFKGKDEAVTTVALSIVGEIIGTLDEAMAGIDKAADRIAFRARQFIELATLYPEWGLTLFRTVWWMPDLRHQLGKHLLADLERGVKSGEFNIEIDDFLISIFASTNMSAVLARVQGTAGPEIGARVAEYQLRMLGVPDAKAAKIARRPLTQLEFKDLNLS